MAPVLPVEMGFLCCHETKHFQGPTKEDEIWYKIYLGSKVKRMPSSVPFLEKSGPELESMSRGPLPCQSLVPSSIQLV